jgi:acyl-Coa thioesterase superfamily protein/acyl-CoA thioesterase superfamily protein
VTEAFYSMDGERATPTELTRGPWDPNAQHAGPPSALLARALELCDPREGARIGRVTVEILAPVPIAPLTVSARVARPGRSVELLEASLEGPDGEVMRARGWRVAAGEITADWERDEPPPGRESGEALEFFPTGQKVGWHTGMEIVFARGRFLEPGPATVWMRPRVPLVEGEQPTPLQRTMLAADGGNGVSAPLDWSRFIFINTDLSVHLLRPPEGEWVCLDSVTHVDGLGFTDTALWDERGRIGRAAQTLFVRERA